MWVIWALGLIGGAAILLFCYAACRAASMADDYAEEYRERLLAETLLRKAGEREE